MADRGTRAGTRVASLRGHLVRSRLAGAVQTSPANTLGNCARLVEGAAEYTFGLSDWYGSSVREVAQAVRSVCGQDLEASPDPDGPGWIDPDATLRGISHHRDTLRAHARPGVRVVLATGHPTGLLGHYIAIARALQVRGCDVLAPLDEAPMGDGGDGRARWLRYIDGVACVSDGGSLRHTHRSRYMEAILDALGGGPGRVDLVVGDHGMAGAAIQRGIPVLSIADVNDVALPLAQVRGRTDGVLPIDDNLSPRLFVPVTEVLLDWGER